MSPPRCAGMRKRCLRRNSACFYRWRRSRFCSRSTISNASVWSRARIALIGDAPFVARPHVGAGVYKAAGDAFALAVALGDGSDADAGLRRLEAERLGIE